MEQQGNGQNSGQNLHNSTTVWSQPNSEQQKKYYSKHAAEKRVFSWISAVLQGAHGVLAFAAWVAIFGWVLASVPSAYFLVPTLACLVLFALHVLLRTTWQTFWYDRLDDDENTDSPIWVPIVVFALLLLCEQQGASMFLAAKVKAPEKQGTEAVEKAHGEVVTAIDAAYTAKKTEISALYNQRIAVVTRSYDAKIRAARRKSATDDSAKRAVNNHVASLNAQKEAEVAPIALKKADALEAAFNQSESRHGSESGRRQAAVTSIDNNNAEEVSRYRNEMGNVGKYSWIISLSLLGLIGGLLYRIVKINVESGILPLRNYTILDAHGSVAERIFTAFSDAFNRRGLQFAVAIHRWLSPHKAITSFDGTVISKPGTYNTPSGFFPPTPSLKDADDILRQKVARKLMEAAEAGELVITPELLTRELEKAKKQNGSYHNTPLGKTEPSMATATTGGKSTPAENKDTSSLDTVPQNVNYVAQSTHRLSVAETVPHSVGADQLLLWLRSVTLREVSNFGKPNRKSKTVSTSINADIATAYAGMKEVGFAPSKEVATKCWLHMVERVFPTINGRGFPYPFEEEFTALLQKTVQEAEYASPELIEV